MGDDSLRVVDVNGVGGIVVGPEKYFTERY